MADLDELDLLTTADVARLLGVGPTSVKRWADAGLIRCVKTAGKHRRFSRDEVERWRREQSEDAQAHPSLDEPSARVSAWMTFLLAEPAPLVLQAELLRDRARLGSWCDVAELVGNVLAELGRGWRAGTVNILQEHHASEALARALARIVESLPDAPDAPRALLLAAQADEHTLGLCLVELALRESGWRSRWAGRRTPTGDVLGLILASQIELVAVSASAASTHEAALQAQAIALGAACRTSGVALILGGDGAWPEVVPYGYRVRSFRELRAILQRALPKADRGA